MQRASYRILTLVLSLAVLAGLFGACSGDDPTRSPSGSFLGENGGIMITAEPAEVVIDPTDPEAPQDPETGKLFVDVLITAVVLDPEGQPVPDTAVTFSSTAGVLTSGGEPVTTDAEGAATDTLRVFEDDPEEIVITVTTELLTETLTLTKTVVIPNEPPVADAGADILVECVSPNGTVVLLDGSGSSDPDSTPETNDDIVSFEWFENFGTPDETLLGEGETLEIELAPGEHVITLRVTDSQGETATDEVVATVADTTPPQVTVELSPSMLWPPYHQMMNVAATVIVTDACSAPVVSLVSVTSNEPDNGLGDGDTPNDVQGVEAGTADYEFQLRAERAGPESGRIYEATYTATDDAGNEGRARAVCIVPHDQGL